MFSVAGEFGFLKSLNMGMEGHSKAAALLPMDPIRGGRKEFMWLLVLCGALPIVATFRRGNEDSMRSAQGNATNKYSRMPVTELSTAL